MLAPGRPRLATLVLLSLLASVALFAMGCGDDSEDQPGPDPVETTTALPGEGVAVRPARATWDTGYFSEALYSRALQELGYQVADHVELANDAFYEAVASGEVTFWANGWFPLHEQYAELFTADASLAGTVAAFGALQGYLVDRPSAEAFGITSLADFSRPEVKAAFDVDGDGRAELYACPEGWACNVVIGHQIDAFGLRVHINEITTPYADSMAIVLARVQRGEPVLFYSWTPNWTISQMPPGEMLMWIEVPGAEHPQGHSAAMLTASGVQGCVADPCFLGFVPSDIRVVANDEFLAENPAAARLFEVMAIPLEDISRQNNRMQAGENTQSDIERHVDEWIALNRVLFDSWIDSAVAAR